MLNSDEAEIRKIIQDRLDAKDSWIIVCSDANTLIDNRFSMMVLKRKVPTEARDGLRLGPQAICVFIVDRKFISAETLLYGLALYTEHTTDELERMKEPFLCVSDPIAGNTSASKYGEQAGLRQIVTEFMAA